LDSGFNHNKGETTMELSSRQLNQPKEHGIFAKFFELVRPRLNWLMQDGEYPRGLPDER
jgi:hypothetical protein